MSHILILPRRTRPMCHQANDFTTSQGRKLDAALTSHGIPHDIKVSPGAFHSFFNDHGRSYNAPVAADSWSRTLAFFAKRLASAPA